MPVQPGTLLGPYEILALLGAGGFGQVFRARDTRLGREVALKLLSQDLTLDGAAINRFVREARAASALNHPNIVTVHDVGQSGDLRFIVMELVDGCTLRELMRREVPVERVIDLGSQIARALNVAHGAGIVHGDIKPENVMVRRDGYVKVVDFGLARLRSLPQPDALTVTAGDSTRGLLLGTLAYMAPEQARSERATSASDIFALGLVLYELTTGRHPFGDGSPLQVLQAIALQPVRLPRIHPRGRCSERLAGTEAYLPFLEALEELLRPDSTGTVARALQRVAPTWASQVLPNGSQELSAALTFRTSRLSRDRLKWELGNFVEELCHTQPLVLVVEDLHWAGASTVDLLAYLGARLGSLRVLTLVTYRLEELELTRHPFLPVKLELQMRGAYREIKLDFLTQHDLARYLDLLFPGHEFPPDFVQLLHAKTDGSPFFMVDLVRALCDRGVITRNGGQWRLTQRLADVAREVPESVRSMIERKIGPAL